MSIFMGETMACILCERVEKSDPAVESQWRCLQADGEPYYICPDHFPADGAGVEAFRSAYSVALDRIMELRRQKGHRA